jgi:hypothetical protein
VPRTAVARTAGAAGDRDERAREAATPLEAGPGAGRPPLRGASGDRGSTTSGAGSSAPRKPPFLAFFFAIAGWSYARTRRGDPVAIAPRRKRLTGLAPTWLPRRARGSAARPTGMSPRASALAIAPQPTPGASARIDLDALEARLRPMRRSFAVAEPFPHVVVDDLLPEDVADALAAEFDDPAIAWQPLHHVNERKAVFGDRDRMGPVAAQAVAALQSPRFLATLGSLTGISGLFGDPELDGAGLHQTGPGGHLNVHADALAHTKQRTWSRQLNLILFLNRDWPQEYRGWLELWNADVSRCVRRIAPAFNRAVLFQTSDISYHGVPEGVACPAGRTRKSLALYYYRDEAQTVRLRPTRYVPRPEDSLARRALIRIDRAMVAAYSLLKRYTPLDDARAARLLRRF